MKDTQPLTWMLSANSSEWSRSRSKSCSSRLTVSRNSYLCKQDEAVEYLGIIINGTAFIEGDGRNLKELAIGDIIGHNVISEFTERLDHPVSVKTKTDGLIAIFPLNEIKIEIRKQPDAVSARGLTACRFSKL